MTFKEFIKDASKGTYAAVRPTEHASHMLRTIMMKHNVLNAEPCDKLHVTLLYSRKHLPDYNPNPSLMFMATPEKFEIWPTKSGKNCLVLKMKSDMLVQRHKQLMADHQATYDYPEYTPHISLSYDAGDIDVSKFNIEDLPMHLIFSYEYEESLDITGK